MRISVIGAGGFGTTVSILMQKKGYQVKLWANFPELSDSLNATRINHDFLPGAVIPAEIFISHDLSEVLKGAELTVIAIPSAFFREILKKIRKTVRNLNCAFLSLTKGIEENSGKLTSEVFSEEFPEKKDSFMVLSGPNLALEIVRGIPTSAVIAGINSGLVSQIQEVLSTEMFRLYSNHDITGVQLGGAYKNVIAIAAGVCDGLGFGLNTKSSLITRGMAEAIRLGVELGALPHTFYGLSGMGDLVATSFSTLSRNRNFGEKLGKGAKTSDILAESQMIVEGVRNTYSFNRLAHKLDIEIPIAAQLEKVLDGNLSPLEAVKELMTRKLKVEIY